MLQLKADDANPASAALKDVDPCCWGGSCMYCSSPTLTVGDTAVKQPVAMKDEYLWKHIDFVDLLATHPAVCQLLVFIIDFKLIKN